MFYFVCQMAFVVFWSMAVCVALPPTDITDCDSPLVVTGAVMLVRVVGFLVVKSKLWIHRYKGKRM